MTSTANGMGFCYSVGGIEPEVIDNCNWIKQKEKKKYVDVCQRK